MVAGHRLHPDRLPDAGGRCVPDAAGVQALLAERRVLAGCRVGGVVDADDQFLGAAGLQGVGDVGAELVVAALVRGDLDAVDVHLRAPVDGAEVELEPLAGADVPVARDREGAAVPHAVLVPFDAGELGLHRVRDEDALLQVLADGRLLAGLGGGELPAAVEVAPGVPGQLRARVLPVGVVRPDLVGPAGVQLVRRAVGAAAPELFDNVAFDVGETALTVVADVGGAAGGARLVADDRLVEGDQEGRGVGRVRPRRAQGPFGAADHRLEVAGEARRGCGQGLREVQLERAAGGLDGGREGSVVVEAVGEAERRLRYGLLAAAGLGPAEVEVGAAVVLEVLDLDVVGPARGQFDGLGGLFAVPVVHPVVDDGLSVDPEAEAVVADDRERVGAGLLRDDLSGPADADVVRTAGGEVQARLQVVEVEVLVEGRRLEGVEVEGAGGGVRVVLALEAVDLGGVVRQGGGRGQAGEGEERGEQ